MSTARILVRGHVHGVFFRDNAQRQALVLGLTGYVRNALDGVEIVVEGEKADIEKFIVWCKKGPPLAHVDSLEVKWQTAAKKFKSFEVRY